MGTKIHIYSVYNVCNHYIRFNRFNPKLNLNEFFKHLSHCRTEQLQALKYTLSSQIHVYIKISALIQKTLMVMSPYYPQAQSEGSAQRTLTCASDACDGRSVAVAVDGRDADAVLSVRQERLQQHRGLTRRNHRLQQRKHQSHQLTIAAQQQDLNHGQLKSHSL